MATVTTNYSSVTDTTAITITLASLPTSSTLVAGQQSTVVDNTSPKYLDARVFGQITTGTTPTTAKTIAIYVFGSIKAASSSFNYPFATTTEIGGGNGAATFEAEQRNMLKLGAAITVNATSDRKYSFDFAVAPLFGGIMPLKWGIFVTHDTVAALNSTAGNHWVHYTGIKADVA